MNACDSAYARANPASSSTRSCCSATCALIVPARGCPRRKPDRIRGPR